MPRLKLVPMLAVLASLAAASALAAEPENTMIITLEDGEVVVGLRPDLAPQHVERIKTLVREGAYDNVAFHRVIDGFMAQTGDVQYADVKDGFDPRRAGTGGSSLPDLPAEFSDVPYERGVVGMARTQDPNSANFQLPELSLPAGLSTARVDRQAEHVGLHLDQLVAGRCGLFGRQGGSGALRSRYIGTGSGRHRSIRQALGAVADRSGLRRQFGLAVILVPLENQHVGDGGQGDD